MPNSYQQQEQLAKSITAVKSVGWLIKKSKKELSKLTAAIEKLIEEKNKLCIFGNSGERSELAELASNLL